MKKMLRMILVIGTFCQCPTMVAQDLLVTQSGDSINCRILEIQPERIDFIVKKHTRGVPTYLPRERVMTFAIGFYDRRNPIGTNRIDSAKVYFIETNHGNVLIGNILQRTGETILMHTDELGDITIKLTQIDKVKELDPAGYRNAAHQWFDYLESSRYFYGPTGYGLKKGDAYYQNVWVLFNQFTMGFTDHFSAGIGTVPLFLFEGSATPLWFTPKFSIPIVENSFNLGAGAMIGSVIGGDFDFGVGYGMATLGDRDANISFGLGYGYQGETESQWNSRPTFSVSAMVRTGKKGYFITENYIFDAVGLLTIGGRRIIRSVTLDFGLVMPVGDGGFVGVPWLGLVIPITTTWGKN
ncbi:MAG: hypothetical protein RIC30_13160 [Marinoscillum sp.]|uniref:hypothetical protein n=1 Tax=Marinoscillum sp. TaxID=2024838 RepID=UPI003300C673